MIIINLNLHLHFNMANLTDYRIPKSLRKINTKINFMHHMMKNRNELFDPSKERDPMYFLFGKFTEN